MFRDDDGSAGYIANLDVAPTLRDLFEASLAERREHLAA